MMSKPICLVFFYISTYRYKMYVFLDSCTVPRSNTYHSPVSLHINNIDFKEDVSFDVSTPGARNLTCDVMVGNVLCC